MVADSGHGSAAKGWAIDLEVADSGLVSCCFSFLPLSLPCVVHYLVFQCTFYYYLTFVLL